MIRSFKGRSIKPGRKVFAYRNLHHDVWSIQQDGLVVAHADEALIENARFTVAEKGRQKVIREGRKNVHAGVRGTWAHGMLMATGGWVTRVSYNPYRAGYFYDAESGEPIHQAQRVHLDAYGKAWAQA
jgi:hypothetical protein